MLAQQLTLASPLEQVTGVGPQLTRHFHTLGLATCRDLLLHFPARYEDFSHLVPLAKLKIGERVTVHGTIQLISTRRSFRRRLTITEALIGDGTATAKAIWFNLPYLTKSLSPGTKVFLAGALEQTAYGLQLNHPVIELDTTSGIHTGRRVPIYPSISGLPQRTLRNLINRILPLVHQLQDRLPEEIERTYQLNSLPTAVSELHFPTTAKKLTTARRRLAFAELYIINLQSKLARSEEQKRPAPTIPFAQSTKKFVAALPFTLTPDQKRAAWEAIQDLAKPHPMFRLIQGDVGSGKTIVAGLAAHNCIAAGYQVVLLAPTELLASQHFATLKKLFSEWPVCLGLLTRGHHEVTRSEAKVTAREFGIQLSQGKIDFAIGTHALLQKNVRFQKLGLVIVDEQHRFGVHERQALTTTAKADTYPHFLSLSATPIPRSLALSIYGDLDLSVIKTLPPGRQPITTKIIEPGKRQSAYALIQREAQAGHRIFIICPLIEESDTLGVRAATSEHARLQRDVFPNIRLGLLHGRLSTAAKTKAMADFRDGTTPILVATAVVEVGVDVPEATVVAIEGAERFGVAQLHQFRGRVGRSSLPSWCLLMAENLSEVAQKRLQAVARFTNGFDLAEFDLQTRGPGDLLNELQSGWGSLRFATLADTELLKATRAAAESTLQLDTTLKKWPDLQKQLQKIKFHPE